MLWRVAVEGAGQLTGVGVARWKAWPAVEKCLLKFSIIVDLSVVTVFLSQLPTVLVKCLGTPTHSRVFLCFYYFLHCTIIVKIVLMSSLLFYNVENCQNKEKVLNE